ncbi:MAG: aminotransferase class V-fold PLP-dependent enzyme [Deltaproteobacteria bacterium]|jgi:cysteine desulfurase family protein|nr:aminotransferase class V-fold PLP-dependent enzyme [Deltaproteobacteria bacterium]
MIYLDNAATSFPKPPEVAAAVSAALAAPASPGRSGHAASLSASKTVHRARKAVAALLGVQDNSRVIFVANVTWALNLALRGLGLKAGDHVLSGPLEHNAVARPLSRLVKEVGVEWEVAPLVAGRVEPAEFARRLRPETKLAVLNHASNVTGALAPIRDVKAALGDVPLLIDAAQTAGAAPLDDAGSWADIVCFTGHKALMGPTGVGGLWVRPGLELAPLAVGGTGSRSDSFEPPEFLPDALEPGTANTHGLAGLAAGIEFVLGVGVQAIAEHERTLVNLFREKTAPLVGLRILDPSARRTGVLSLNLPGWSASELAVELEAEAGVLTRAGLHCAPLAHQSLGTFPGGAVRFSFGWFTSRSDALTAAEAVLAVSRRGRRNPTAGRGLVKSLGAKPFDADKEVLAARAAAAEAKAARAAEAEAEAVRAAEAEAEAARAAEAEAAGAAGDL